MTEEAMVENGKQNMLLSGAHKLFLASIGAVLLTQEELAHLTSKFVEEGATFEEKNRERINKYVDKRRKESKKTSKRVSKRVDNRVNKQMGKVLNRMNIPTRDEIQTLNKKVTRLNKKVDELAKETAVA